MFLISNDENLTIPNFLRALGFIPPKGMDIDEIFVNDENVSQVNQTLENSGFEAAAVNPNYKTVKYQRKDPRLSHSFSDNYVVPEAAAAELAEFPKHIQQVSAENRPTPQYNVIKSPVKAVTIVEDTVNKCYMLRLNEDYLFPKGTILKMNENESELSDINYTGENNIESGEIGQYAKAALYAQLLANDLKTMHLHAVGDDFDKIHQISEVLYEEAMSEADDLSELAISNGEQVPNASLIAQFVDIESEWPPLVGETFNWPQFVSNLQKIGSSYLGVLDGVKDAPEVDDMIIFWNKEINYKNAARGFGHEDEAYEADYLDNLTDPELQFNTNQNNPDDISDEVVDMIMYNDAKANNSTWNGYESMTTPMMVTGGEEVQDGDLSDIDTSTQEFESNTNDYALTFDFDNVEGDEEEEEEGKKDGE